MTSKTPVTVELAPELVDSWDKWKELPRITRQLLHYQLRPEICEAT